MPHCAASGMFAKTAFDMTTSNWLSGNGSFSLETQNAVGCFMFSLAHSMLPDTMSVPTAVHFRSLAIKSSAWPQPVPQSNSVEPSLSPSNSATVLCLKSMTGAMLEEALLLWFHMPEARSHCDELAVPP